MGFWTMKTKQYFSALGASIEIEAKTKREAKSKLNAIDNRLLETVQKYLNRKLPTGVKVDFIFVDKQEIEE